VPDYVRDEGGYDTRDFVGRCRDADVTPHVAQMENQRRSSAIDRRTTRHRGYAISQQIRKRIEQILAWIKTVGGLRRTRLKAARERSSPRTWSVLLTTCYESRSRGGARRERRECRGRWPPAHGASAGTSERDF
jgi:hypothetical protein